MAEAASTEEDGVAIFLLVAITEGISDLWPTARVID